MEWRLTEQGPRATVEVWREESGEGLYKAHLIGPAGRCLLGTLVPEGGRLFLRRTLSIDSLRRQGAWPVKSVEEERVRLCAGRPADIQWEDEVLAQSARRLPRHTLRREGEGFSLSFPFDPRAPFPLLPAFCFARVEGGRLIVSFQKGGLPYIPQNQGNPKGEVNGERGETHGKPDHQGAQRPGGPAGL